MKVLLETGCVNLDGQIYRLKLVWGHCRCEDRPEKNPRSDPDNLPRSIFHLCTGWGDPSASWQRRSNFHGAGTRLFPKWFKSRWEVSGEIVDQRLWITSTLQDIPSLDCIGIFKIKASLQNQEPLARLSLQCRLGLFFAKKHQKFDVSNLKTLLSHAEMLSCCTPNQVFQTTSNPWIFWVKRNGRMVLDRCGTPEHQGCVLLVFVSWAWSTSASAVLTWTVRLDKTGGLTNPSQVGVGPGNQKLSYQDETTRMLVTPMNPKNHLNSPVSAAWPAQDFPIPVVPTWPGCCKGN